MEFALLGIFFWCAIGGGIGAAIGATKGRGGQGFVLGFLLGFIGWIIVGVMQPTMEYEVRRARAVAAATGDQPQMAPGAPGGMRECPFCAELIKQAAVVCRYCARDVQPVSAPTWEPEDSSETDRRWAEWSKGAAPREGIEEG